MSGDLRIEIRIKDQLFVVNYEEEPLDEAADDVRCPNCDSKNIVEHRIGLTEVEIYDFSTHKRIDPNSDLGRELLMDATAIANGGLFNKPYTCDDCCHDFH